MGVLELDSLGGCLVTCLGMWVVLDSIDEAQLTPKDTIHWSWTP